MSFLGGIKGGAPAEIEHLKYCHGAQIHVVYKVTFHVPDTYYYWRVTSLLCVLSVPDGIDRVSFFIDISP